MFLDIASNDRIAYRGISFNHFYHIELLQIALSGSRYAEEIKFYHPGIVFSVTALYDPFHLCHFIFVIILITTVARESFVVIVSEGSKQIGPHACTVCQSVVEGNTHSRALPRSQASQYGLREDQVLPGARVCNTCRCKAVRGRYTACPLPGCPNLNSSKSRVKRLRALPSKWLDLPPEIREPIAQEFREYLIKLLWIRDTFFFRKIHILLYYIACVMY